MKTMTKKKTDDTAAAATPEPKAIKPSAPDKPRPLPAGAPPLDTPYRHPKTGQTVYHEANGWAYTATGVPVAPLQRKPGN